MGSVTNKHVTHGGVHCTTNTLLYTLTTCFASQLVYLISHKRENRSDLFILLFRFSQDSSLSKFCFLTAGTANIFKAACQLVTKSSVLVESTTKQIWQSLQSQMQSLLTRLLASEVLNLQYIITAINKGRHIIQLLMFCVLKTHRYLIVV